ncbi:MAG: endonuclease/exonuclease/phosphatase family protein [Phycisphaerales bacterium]|nr:endonuclease/exonuclease/phosphatase family protein [Phycisphaerales bacterium]
MRQFAGAFCAAVMATGALAQESQTLGIRVATFNLEDVRPDDVADAHNPRMRRLAETIQRIGPNVILLNEIAFAAPNDFSRPETGAWTAEHFVKNYLSVPQKEGLTPITYRIYTSRPNTGMPSGFDLDQNGEAQSAFPLPDPLRADSTRAAPNERARTYGNDCWGYGTFPGQYGMALLVDDRLAIEETAIRTFRLFPWKSMPDPELPRHADGSMFYSEEVLDLFRLSSKSHWDVPVRLPNGAVVHFLCSHPTPPAFDGPEGRNKRRNHDEIRFWADYIANADYLVDDAEVRGGLPAGSAFVILGDLNADPDEGDSYRDPIDRFLLSNPRISSGTVPASDISIEGLDPDDTARFGLRVDYILPSASLTPLASGVWRLIEEGDTDHFPVWMDLAVPPAP